MGIPKKGDNHQIPYMQVWLEAPRFLQMKSCLDGWMDGEAGWEALGSERQGPGNSRKGLARASEKRTRALAGR